MEVYSYRSSSGFDRHTFDLMSRTTEYAVPLGILCKKGIPQLLAF